MLTVEGVSPLGEGVVAPDHQERAAAFHVLFDARQVGRHFVGRVGEVLEDHLSLTYGDHIPALLALANLLHMPVLRL